MYRSASSTSSVVTMMSSLLSWRAALAWREPTWASSQSLVFYMPSRSLLSACAAGFMVFLARLMHCLCIINAVAPSVEVLTIGLTWHKAGSQLAATLPMRHASFLMLSCEKLSHWLLKHVKQTIMMILRCANSYRLTATCGLTVPCVHCSYSQLVSLSAGTRWRS